MVRKVFLIGGVVMLGLVLQASACEEERILDTASGGDETRRTALKLFFGQNVTDSINDLQGDNTDWKEIRVREAGTMGIIISIDNPRDMRGEITIHDGFGTLLERRDIRSSDNLFTFDRIPVDQGDYYVKLFVNRGASVYTAGATFDGLPRAEFERLPPRVEPGTDNEVGTGPRVRRDPKTNEGPGGDKKNDETEVKEASTEVPDTGEGFLSINGRIVRFVPVDDGGAVLTIAGIGSDNGASAGMVGTIVGLGKKFRITRVQRKGVVAYTKADPEELEPYKSVVLRVKRQ
jgi:hypothetical protein